MGYALLKEKGLLRPKVGHPRLSARQRAARRWNRREKDILTLGCTSGPTLPGQYYDQETKLHYNYHRYYDPSVGRYITSDPIGILRDYSDPQLQIALEQGSLEETGFANESLSHLYGYVGQNPLIWYDPYGLAAKGNQKLDQDQVDRIKEQLKDPNLNKKKRNELKQKLKRHEKATGQRHSRISKDKFLKRCIKFIAPGLAEAFYPSPQRACDLHQNEPEFCDSI